MHSYHITKEGDHWKLAREGSARASLTADTKQEIINATRRFMKNKEASVKIHKLDGKIQEERTYSSGPRGPRGVELRKGMRKAKRKLQ